MATLRGPNTRFELVVVAGPDLDGWCRVGVSLDAQAGHWSAEKLRPAWAGGDPDEPFRVALPAEPGQLRRAAEALRGGRDSE
jgi:hypothetical protein